MAFRLPLLGLIALSLFGILSQGLPSVSLQPRGKAQIVIDLLKIFGLVTEETDAWDYDENPDMCLVYMTTEDGGNCEVTVECKDTEKHVIENPEWSLCYVGGRNCFQDDNIGEFCVIFTKKDGREGEGLTEPTLEVPSVEGVIPVSELAEDWYYSEDQNCPSSGGQACAEGPFVCYLGDSGGRKKRWGCGVPKKDADFPEGIKYEDLLDQID
ncbi:hypothetical protein N7509_009520 [Penicillium cosmopolitanum]|uniref:Uncharacterized protein n=1 Tax=Penicillium cosmopolitanum TaxID=1131564 RepID=A0A9W9VPQ2_9EURO|nr:uncharacterized protein N7509_009520 [Penicillium cosmopolitanum]KAJ5386979.1 hypothetical protein N7509_009520 [Penicillium cosmopolitanum]